MHSLGGTTLLLDRSDINTDEIIPAKYLTEIHKAALGEHLLEDLDMPLDRNKITKKDYGSALSRDNFGCGSSREHAPWAFQENAINLIVAVSFARIFRQNMFNAGMLALTLPPDRVDALFAMGHSHQGQLEFMADPATRQLVAQAGDERMVETFVLNPFQRDLVLAGGWVHYAQQHY